MSSLERFLLYLLAATCILVACAPLVPVSSPLGTPGDADMAFGQGLAASTLEDSSPPVYGGFKILYASCDNRIKGQGSPITICRERPQVGVPHRVGWTVNPTGPFDENRPAFLLVWFEDSPPANLTAFGYQGCTFHGPLDPKRLLTLTPTSGSPLTQSGGIMQLNWTPPAAWLGKHVFCQAVVYSPGSNDKGWLLSPAIRLLVGNQ